MTVTLSIILAAQVVAGPTDAAAAEAKRQIEEFRVCLFQEATQWAKGAAPESKVAELAWQYCVNPSGGDVRPDPAAPHRVVAEVVDYKMEIFNLRRFIREFRAKREQDLADVIYP